MGPRVSRGIDKRARTGGKLEKGEVSLFFDPLALVVSLAFLSGGLKATLRGFLFVCFWCVCVCVCLFVCVCMCVHQKSYEFDI